MAGPLYSIQQSGMQMMLVKRPLVGHVSYLFPPEICYRLIHGWLEKYV